MYSYKFLKSFKMSASTVNNKKPFCKVCLDAGKCESEYTSHWVRTLPDRNGNTTITCPLLMKTECRYCYKLGHTVKFCTKLKKDNARQNKPNKIMKIEEVKKTKKPVNTFDGLMSDSEEEASEEVKEASKEMMEEFPVLIAPPKSAVEVKSNWVSVLVNPAPAPIKLAPIVAKPVEEKKPVAKSAPWTSAKQPAKSWAYETDSDDDDMSINDYNNNGDEYEDYDADKFAFGYDPVNDDYDNTW